jgi:hypothetical protein
MTEQEAREVTDGHPELVTARVVKDELGRLVVEVPMPPGPGRGYRLVRGKAEAEGVFVVLAPV